MRRRPGWLIRSRMRVSSHRHDRCRSTPDSTSTPNFSCRSHSIADHAVRISTHLSCLSPTGFCASCGSGAYQSRKPVSGSYGPPPGSSSPYAPGAGLYGPYGPSTRWSSCGGCESSASPLPAASPSPTVPPLPGESADVLFPGGSPTTAHQIQGTHQSEP